jgi:SAM-dependent methyltransferase
VPDANADAAGVARQHEAVRRAADLFARLDHGRYFMELTVPPHSPLPVRAWGALRSRGARYAWHKLLRRGLRYWPARKRQWLYTDPRVYWTMRGGDDYFREQEGQAARSQRACWMAERLASYRPDSILEIGCGYGKLLGELRHRLDVPLVGVDFSWTQLHQAQQFLEGLDGIQTTLARGERLPFPDGSFDMVVTSAVILHNPPAAAERIRDEILRVARRFAAHNEERGLSYNRYGYDTAAWYRERGIGLVESGPIPADPDPATSQFCVARLDGQRCRAKSVAVA